MDEIPAFVGLGVALAAGLLIGFERQQSAAKDRDKDRASMGGVRTFPIVALAGALSALLARPLGAWFVALAFAPVAALVAVSYADDVRRARGHGVTSEAAMLVAFLLGALTTADGVFETRREAWLVVGAAAIVVTLVLSLKPPLHALAGKATKEDVLSGLKFLLVALVVVPLLPNRATGPLDALNPFKLGVLVAVLTGVGFAGYLAMRALGARRGLVLTGLLGGLVSSTAVTLAASRVAKKSAKAAASAAAAVVVANTVMGVRVLVVAAAFDLELCRALAGPVAVVVAVGASASVVFWRRGRDAAAAELAVKNPVELVAAVEMTLVVAAVLVVTKAAAQRLGDGGVYATSALAGVVDVDAVTVSMAELAGASLAARATAVLVAVAANTATKAAVARIVGGPRFGRAVLAPAAATIAAAAAGVAWVWIVER